jgi:hypothetical protein
VKQFLSLLWNMPGRVAAAMLKVADLRAWSMILAAVALTIAAGALTLIVWLSDKWPVALRDKQLDYIGVSLIIAWAGILIVLCATALMRVSVKGPGGLGIDIGSNPAPPVVTTTTTTVTPTATPAVSPTPEEGD